MHEINSNRLRPGTSFTGEGRRRIGGIGRHAGVTEPAGANRGRRKFAPKCGYALRRRSELYRLRWTVA